MPYLILFLLIIYPVAEIALMSAAVDAIGWGWVLTGIVGSFVLGVTMIRQYRLAFALTLMKDLRSGQVGPGTLFALARYYIAAVLLILPGLGGDVLGLLLLLPWRWKTPAAPQRPVPDDVLEGEYREVRDGRQSLEDRRD
ncbi:FxsA family protein [Chitinilyticum piscinae]|uniref:FxsA family protein n=1 Tax=Chitinilyticum piscinae TaxID=2866724 RepID=A0A8J7G1Y5_9NEIS|nr:FxsA family protein [Chitinilyticum piscinae]MBE9609893.1 FxsA family protein [Chitinilyticum piscinae]